MVLRGRLSQADGVGEGPAARAARLRPGKFPPCRETNKTQVAWSTKDHGLLELSQSPSDWKLGSRRISRRRLCHDLKPGGKKGTRLEQGQEDHSRPAVGHRWSKSSGRENGPG